MIDKTTVGVTVEPDEVESALRSACGYHLAEPDPLIRYAVLTQEQVLYDALVTALKRERGRALAQLADAGVKLTQIATMTNLTSRQQVQRLITIAKDAEEEAAEVRATSREFDERLAAVEATLDEVVSGFTPAATSAAGSDPNSSVTVEPTPLSGAFMVPVMSGAVNATSLSATGAGSPNPGLIDESGSASSSVETGRAIQPESHDRPSATHGSVDDSAAIELSHQSAPEPAVLLETTQLLSALQSMVQPTNELPVNNSDVPWWRRAREARERDTGAA